MNLIELKKELNNIIITTHGKQIVRKIMCNKNIKEAIIKYSPFFLNDNVKFTERIYCIVNNIEAIIICKECKKKKVKFDTLNKGYVSFCSTKCSNKNTDTKKKKVKTFISKYGYSNPFSDKKIQKKIKETNISKYGVEYPLQNKVIFDKVKKTNIQRYGEDTPLKNKNIKRKIKETCIKRYGVDNPMKAPFIQNKVQINNIIKYGNKCSLNNTVISLKKIDTNIKKYGYEYPLQNKNIINNLKNTRKYKAYIKYRDKYKEYIDTYFYHNIKQENILTEGLLGKYRLQCKKCHTILKDTFLYNQRLPICLKCNPFNNGISKQEKELINIISKYYSKNIISNNRKILKGKELDIYIPEKNLAIEYNGLMWHSIGKHKSAKFNNNELELEIKNKHLWKTEECQKQGIQLLHIFENEWLNPIKQDIWKNIIKNKMGTNNNKIFARTTTIKELSNEEAIVFLNMYHLQGNVASKVKIGLFDKKGTLLQLMTFGKSRFDKNIDWEILRFATKSGINVIGGASKIFKYFKDNYLENGQSIKTYADLRFSNGNIYRKLGFKKIKQSNPNYFYFKEGILDLESRQKYQKHKLKDKLEIFDQNLTESENMYNNGYRKIYDCGNLVFMYTKKKED